MITTTRSSLQASISSLQASISSVENQFVTMIYKAESAPRHSPKDSNSSLQVIDLTINGRKKKIRHRTWREGLRLWICSYTWRCNYQCWILRTYNVLKLIIGFSVRKNHFLCLRCSKDCLSSALEVSRHKKIFYYLMCIFGIYWAEESSWSYTILSRERYSDYGFLLKFVS